MLFSLLVAGALLLAQLQAASRKPQAASYKRQAVRAAHKLVC
jgi:hypothetical protein|tara:strand:+ start:411 stop:536 length:126 start_codon:yes stop_codon:yes gene_type:complete